MPEAMLFFFKTAMPILPKQGGNLFYFLSRFCMGKKDGANRCSTRKVKYLFKSGNGIGNNKGKNREADPDYKYIIAYP